MFVLTSSSGKDLRSLYSRRNPGNGIYALSSDFPVTNVVFVSCGNPRVSYLHGIKCNIVRPVGFPRCLCQESFLSLSPLNIRTTYIVVGAWMEIPLKVQEHGSRGGIRRKVKASLENPSSTFLLL